MPIYEYSCSCGLKKDEYRKIDDRNNVPKCTLCDKDMNLTISQTNVSNVESFNSHYDMILGKYFSSKEEKENYLSGKNKQQTGGPLSPRTTTKEQIICSESQAKKLETFGTDEKKERLEI